MGSRGFPLATTDDPTPEQIELAKELLAVGAIQFGEFTLTSGRKSSYYVNLKAALAEPAILRRIARMISCSMPQNTGCVAGMELGAVPIAVAVALEAQLPYAMIRKGKRAHGTGSRIEGALSQEVVVVEDVATTGGSLVEALEVLKEHDCTILDIVVIVDREEGGSEALRAQGYELRPLLTISMINAIKAGN